VSIPFNITMSLWYILSSPFVRRRLEKLEQKNWITTTTSTSTTTNNNDNKSNNNNNVKPCLEMSSPIAIIGAGIGGLSVAHFLIRCGYTNVRVFEKFDNCGLDRGGGHGLISGMWCFRSMGMLDVYSETVTPATEWKFDSGRWWLSWALPFRWLHSNPFLPALCYNLGSFLRSDFLKYLSETLPEGVLQLEHDLKGIHELESGMVRVAFANGKEYCARLVIGCDGSKSEVRTLMKPTLDQNGTDTDTDDERVTESTPLSLTKTKTNSKDSTAAAALDPFYVDINVWWCVTKLSNIPKTERRATQWDNGPSRLYFEGGAIMHLIANDNLILVVDYRAPSLRKHHKNWKANSKGADLLEFMKVWGVPSKYWTVAEHASRVAQFAIPKGLGSEKAVATQTQWHNSTNIVLLGDAVHPTPHFFGQGANAAIQDAYCLVRCLRTEKDDGNDGSDTDLSDAFSEYVRIRKPPAKDIISKSYLLGLTETAGGIPRLVRDLIFFTVLKTGLFVWAAVDINTVRV
jgi:2-polyprenyl-6-methoxyphenol hydroxylase-like FAD-dependent oxidoreductase